MGRAPMFSRHLHLPRMAPSVAARRTSIIAHHMMSTSTRPTPVDQAPVLFESNGSLRTYILNRPAKLNALDESMLNILRPKIEEWSKGDLPGVIVGTGVGRAFCAGGDVAGVVQNAAKPESKSKAIDFFKREFELDWILSAMPKPYIAVMDGITMGGGVGLSVNALFRVATENTLFAMPETKIGYCPDVGASYFLSRVDGQIGTYLALTGDAISGRTAFHHGFATHFISSRRIPSLLENLASLDHPTPAQIDSTLEEHITELEPEESASPFVGARRVALDSAFSHNSVEKIFDELRTLSTESPDKDVREWAEKTLETLELRSPTSLKVALAAIRKGKHMQLLEALQMEMNIATAYCDGASPDFHTGVTAVLLAKTKGRPEWSPPTVSHIKDEDIQETFFSKYSHLNGNAPLLEPPLHLAAPGKAQNPMRYALPTEEEIGQMVDGSHPSSGGTEITEDELLAKFLDMKKGKAGVREKVLEVVQRRCLFEQDKHLNKKWLKWKH